MNIWLINHYAVPNKYYPLARPATFAKYLMRMGHTVTIFAASTVHNSDKNLITDGSLYKEEIVDEIHYVYVRDCDYTGNGLKRIINMMLFAIRLPRVCKRFPKPDAILATSVTPLACMKGIKLAKEYGCRGVAEIADLWPETFVAYELIGKNNLLLKSMYTFERRLYSNADAIVFTMEGGKDYIISMNWDKEHGGPVDMGKVHHINNGVDLEVFKYNRDHGDYHDPDIDDQTHFKAVYTGAIRDVNGVDQLVDVAKCLKDKGDARIRLLIYGDGDKRDTLERKASELHLDNIVFKGNIAKNSVPYVLSKADICLLHWKQTPISDYGMSMNKFFEYLAAGKPILSSSKPKYDIVSECGCGLSINIHDSEEYAVLLERFENMPKDELEVYSANALRAANKYDFEKLTKTLLCIIEGKEA
jgi:glycosyltransferase involved in cell wall biosynthesis